LTAENQTSTFPGIRLLWCLLKALSGGVPSMYCTQAHRNAQPLPAEEQLACAYMANNHVLCTIRGIQAQGLQPLCAHSELKQEGAASTGAYSNLTSPPSTSNSDGTSRHCPSCATTPERELTTTKCRAEPGARVQWFITEPNLALSCRGPGLQVSIWQWRGVCPTHGPWYEGGCPRVELLG